MIGRRSALIFANNVAGALLGLVAIRLVAQYLGPGITNPVEFGLGFFGMFFFLTDLAFGQAHTKRVSEGLDEGDCLATFGVFKLVATGAFAVVGGAIVAWASFLRPETVQDPRLTPGVLLLVLLYYSVKSLMSIPNATFDAHRQSARGQLGVLVDTTVRVAATILLALLVGGAVLQRGPLAGWITTSTPYLGWLVRNPAAALAATYLVGTSAALVVTLRYMRRFARLGRFRMDILKGYAAFAMPLAAVAAVTVVATNVDRAALGFFGEGEEAALFGYTRRITIFVETIPLAVAALLFPTVSALHGRGDAGRVAEVHARAARYISMVVMPLVAFVIVFAPQVIHLFLSDAWLPAVPALRLLALFSLTYALVTPHTTLLAGVGRTRTMARIAVLVAAGNIVLNLLLIPRDLTALGLPGVRLGGLGVTGAALATVTSMLAGYVLYRREAARIVPIRDIHVVKHLVAALAMAGVLAAMIVAVEGGSLLAPALGIRWFHLAAMGLVGGVVYLGALVLLRELAREDVAFFRDVAHPLEMLAYVREELRLKRGPPRPGR